MYDQRLKKVSYVDSETTVQGILHDAKNANILQFSITSENTMPKIDYAAIEIRYGSSYPGELKNICDGCERKNIGDHAGLAQFGCNYTRLRPGAATSLRHWHENEDELVIVFEGEVVRM